MAALTSSFAIGFVGSVVGLIGAFGAVYLRYWLQTRKETAKLRTALIAEIESTTWLTEDMLPDIEQALEHREATHDYFPTDVYATNIANLGLLDGDEIEHVIRYYTLAQIAAIQVNDIYEGDGDVTDFVEQTLATLENELKSIEESVRDLCYIFFVLGW
jgi:hypothetical protein